MRTRRLLDPVFRDFPELVVVLAHGGRGWWYAAGRVPRPDDGRTCGSRSPGCRRSDSPTTTASSLRRLADKMIFGTDWPGVPSVRENASTLAAALKVAGCTDYQVAAALGRNAARVFGL